MRRRLLEWMIGSIVLGSLLAVYRWHGGASLWFMILLAAIMMTGGLLIQLFGPSQISVERTLESMVINSGDEAVITTHVGFRTLLPIPWLALNDYYTDGSFRKILFPGFRRSFTYSYKLTDLTRGHYIFDACLVEWGGLFGWFRGSRVLKSVEQLIVLAEPLSLGYDLRPSAAVPGERRQQDWNSTSGAGIKGLEIREYMAGDPLNRIHWKSSAKRGRLHTFLPEDTRESAFGVILDTSISGYLTDSLNEDDREEAAHEAFETAVSAAAGLLLTTSQTGGRTELICGRDAMGTHSSGAHDESVPFQDEAGAMNNMLTHLSKLSLSEGPPLSMLLEEAGRRILPGMRIAVVTGALNEELAGAVSRIKALGAKIDIYCTGSIPGELQAGSSAQLSSSNPNLFSIAALLSRIGAGVFVIQNNRVSRIGHVETTLSGEGAV